MNFTQQLWSVKEWGRVMATRSEYVTLVHEATNEEKWGPTGPQMDAVCNAYPRGGSEILNELRSRLNNRDKSWRPCYKSLLVLDYLARNVDERFLPEICSLVPLMRIISTTFYYTNPKGVDHGVSVRERAKKLADLLSDGLQLREERVVAAQIKEKLSHNASDGGGPNTYGSGYNGGYGGGYEYDRYGGSGRGTRQAYDSYRFSPPPAQLSSRPRTKEEQERYDMEMALRMQRDEERRTGISAEQLEEMYANKVRQRRGETERQRMAAEDDERLARRLQQEEEERARRQGRSLPTLSSDQPPAPPARVASPKPPAPAEPAKPKQPATDALDDLFSPAPVAAPAAAAPATPKDPFDAFLETRSAPAPPPPNPWGQPPPQQTFPPQNTWGQPQVANNAWGAPQQWTQQSVPSLPQPNPWGQSVSSPPSSGWGQPQQSNSWTQFQQGPSQQQQQQTSNSFSAGSWGQPASSRLQDPWGQPQQPPQASSWGQFQQQPQSSSWGQPSAPAPQQSGSGQAPAAAEATASGVNNNTGDLGSMWGALNQFSNQQQRK
ncbi:hypothetical protein LSCM1_05265 [Leishmania martiniquensis]|uniref:ENTH domain-containing protein n=1 Tax=Leishmania martiniquensis TaxID=1580590 RepID=A0A836KL23_9TRYP|nr:hypothetical protein LSCM1_05265 [Leishmania martiniquensis]